MSTQIYHYLLTAEPARAGANAVLEAVNQNTQEKSWLCEWAADGIEVSAKRRFQKIVASVEKLEYFTDGGRLYIASSHKDVLRNTLTALQRDGLFQGHWPGLTEAPPPPPPAPAPPPRQPQPPPKPPGSSLKMASVMAAVALLVAGGVGWQVHVEETKKHEGEIRAIQDRLEREQKEAEAARNEAKAVTEAAERERKRLEEQRAAEKLAAEQRAAEQSAAEQQAVELRGAETKRASDQKAELDRRAREQAEILRRIEDKRKADEAARMPPLRIPPAWNPSATTDPKQRLAEINQKEAGWRASLRNYHTLTLKNDCMDGPVAVAIRYLPPEGVEQWVTQGWFVVQAGKTLDTGAVSRDGQFFVYGQGAGHTWSGDNKDGSVKLWVTSSAFAFIPGDKPPDAGKRMVSFFLRGFTQPGSHSQRFVCGAK